VGAAPTDREKVLGMVAGQPGERLARLLITHPGAVLFYDVTGGAAAAGRWADAAELARADFLITRDAGPRDTVRHYFGTVAPRPLGEAPKDMRAMTPAQAGLWAAVVYRGVVERLSEGWAARLARGV